MLLEVVANRFENACTRPKPKQSGALKMLAFAQARSTYDEVLVSILSLSPMFTKSGT